MYFGVGVRVASVFLQFTCSFVVALSINKNQNSNGISDAEMKMKGRLHTLDDDEVFRLPKLMKLIFTKAGDATQIKRRT